MIRFARDSYGELLDASIDVGSEEVCGVLSGGFDERESLVTDVHPAENVANTPTTRYAIDPDELLEILEAVEAACEDVVGFYHTHPRGPPHPTETDVERATWRGYSYVICALNGYPVLGSWRWQGDDVGFERESVAVRSRGEGDAR